MFINKYGILQIVRETKDNNKQKENRMNNFFRTLWKGEKKKLKKNNDTYINCSWDEARKDPLGVLSKNKKKNVYLYLG